VFGSPNHVMPFAEDPGHDLRLDSREAERDRRTAAVEARGAVNLDASLQDEGMHQEQEGMAEDRAADAEGQAQEAREEAAEHHAERDS